MDSFRFANPECLWLLWLPVLLTALFVGARFLSRKALRRYGNVALLRPLMPGVSEAKLRLKFVLQMLAVASLALAAARPQFGSKLETVRKEGVEVMVCLDISNSMMAEDIQPNRLEKAKRMLSKLLDRMSDDQVGLIVFAGDAFTQVPITNDFVSAKMFLSSIDPRMVSIQGTAIGAAIQLATRSFTPNEGSEKAIILITDGENHEDDATGAAAAALERGIKTHVIGIGSPQGSLVPDDSGRKGSYRKDGQGNPVTSRLNEQMAQEIAAAGQGIYARADNSNSALNAVADALDGMKKTELESHVYADYDDKFEWFALIAFLCILLDLFLLDRANPLLSRLRLFDAKAASLTVLLLLTAASASAQRQTRLSTRQGNDLYNKEQYLESEIAYRRALEANPGDSIATFNLGNALLRQQKADDALQQYVRAAQQALAGGDRGMAAKALFNAGDLMMGAQQYDKALDFFKQSLRQDPTDDEARYNMVLARKLMQQNQQDQDQNQDQQNKQNQQDQDQQQDQQQQDKQDQQEQQDQNQQQQQEEQPQQQNQQNQQQEQQQQQGQPPQMSQEQAEQILQAAERDEKDMQRRVQEAQMQKMQQRRRTDKDW